MSVPEMRQILGLGKTESYWLIHKKYFETIIVAKQMRVLLDSFEDWYANQFHYQKINGPSPGAKWISKTRSVEDTADLLGVSIRVVYDLLRKKLFKTRYIANKIRIDINSFEKWYRNQTYYQKVEEMGGDKFGIDC